ncbi:hypothetical protein B188_02360 [Candidatus Brocadiaceae bacterium B188]|jgi:type IV pilus assembly protein PilW|nr:prepilin-type N-terminal cleavage/methylation domain-containing protein [Candidatus Brocadia sapporoensis]MEB2308631.1 prepilin-type N-terminal cleavage/methylation domain-containing protein [Candidatus Brocadiaceae bacterium]OQZ03096.1 MAG: hypothetical protein B6D34_09595 [Candidatus Brocadia sp. UTAMX1]QQR67478.1 MAG: prepilin-type N-terminal cleavage/methylation domain-containing protein [Candidatus Brocadia sp.]RZV56785.1 MAG: prepilin-type N-terminal cleavage/methylation domain-contain
MSYTSRNKDQGFTLIEVVIGLAICLILMGVTVSIFNIQRKSYSTQERVAEMQQNVRAAMDMMVREIRMAGYDPTNYGLIGIGTNTTTSIQILADLDGNGTTTAGLNEDITYSYYGANSGADACKIKRKTGGGGFQPFVDNIAGFNFLYYDGSGTTTTAAASIRQIKITITGKTANTASNLGCKYGTFTSLVIPENLNY